MNKLNVIKTMLAQCLVLPERIPTYKNDEFTLFQTQHGTIFAHEMLRKILLGWNKGFLTEDKIMSKQLDQFLLQVKYCLYNGNTFTRFGS